MAHATTVIATLLDLGQIESCLLTTAAPRAKNFQVINVLLGYQRSLVPPFTGHAPAPSKRTTPTSRARDTPKCPNQGNSLESRRPPHLCQGTRESCQSLLSDTVLPIATSRINGSGYAASVDVAGAFEAEAGALEPLSVFELEADPPSPVFVDSKELLDALESDDEAVDADDDETGVDRESFL